LVKISLSYTQIQTAMISYGQQFVIMISRKLPNSNIFKWFHVKQKRNQYWFTS